MSLFEINVDENVGKIIIEETYACSKHISFLDTKEKAIQDALIKLGWTPPITCPNCNSNLISNGYFCHCGYEE